MVWIWIERCLAKVISNKIMRNVFWNSARARNKLIKCANRPGWMAKRVEIMLIGRGGRTIFGIGSFEQVPFFS